MDSRASLQRPDSRLSLRGPQGTKQSLAAFLSLVCTLSSFVFFTACSDFGERDNPLDPGASNYEAVIEKPESSSSSVKSDKSSSSVEKSKFSSSSVKQDSAAASCSSSVKVLPSSSSKVPTSAEQGRSKPAEESSSSIEKPKSSSSVKTDSAAASCSSSIKMQPSSSSQKPEQTSSSSVVPASSGNLPASSSSSVKTQPSSSSQKPEQTSSSSVIPASSGNLPASSTSSVKVQPSSSSQKPEQTSSSSVIPASSENLPASSSSSIKTQPSSSSQKPEQTSSSSVVPASSGNLPASSSSVKASSSSITPWTCGDSTLTRGDHEYATVVINEQCWTKENLRYEPSSGTTLCYGNKAENCETYGRLYDFEAANLACPTGWRLPTKTEFEDMADYSGGDMYDAGTHFKAISGWTGESGDDLLEFTALPGGKCDEEQTCSKIGTSGYWWTSTEKVKKTSHYALYLNGDGGTFTAANIMDNDQYISVRCVKK